MAYVITRACTGCGKCEFACSEGAISRGWKKYEIDPDLCDSCGACEYICPAGAVEPDQLFVHQLKVILPDPFQILRRGE